MSAARKRRAMKMLADAHTKGDILRAVAVWHGVKVINARIGHAQAAAEARRKAKRK